MQLLLCSLSYVCMLRSELREERQKKRESRSMLDAVCVPPLGEKYSPMPCTQKCRSASSQLCVLCSRQSRGLQLACSPLAHLYIETKIYVCDSVVVVECMKEGSKVAAPDLLTLLHLYARV